MPDDYESRLFEGRPVNQLLWLPDENETLIPTVHLMDAEYDPQTVTFDAEGNAVIEPQRTGMKYAAFSYDQLMLLADLADLVSEACDEEETG